MRITLPCGFLGLLLVACAVDTSSNDDEEVVDRVAQPIIGGNTLAPSQTNAVYIDGVGSGTLISPRWVLTSAHQIDTPSLRQNPSQLTVRLGAGISAKNFD